MPPVRVVVANRVEALPKSLLTASSRESQIFATVHATSEVRETVPRLRAQLAIVDLEVVSFSELADLCNEFPATAFVCTHRLADDSMWTQALSAGAVDCCQSTDLPLILESADRYVAIKKAEATTAA
jgi:hypothetical protein